jgi:pyridoxamine-phosphate oxidase
MEQDPIYKEAIVCFQEIFARVEEGPVEEPAAVTLATADLDGRPSSRVVLLRGLDNRGFVFFTNSLSRKGRQLEANPQAALSFYWDFLGQQVRIEGNTEKVDDKESDNYWIHRPRDSRIGAWASRQSERLVDRAELDSRIEKYKETYVNQDVPRPPHWYGYRVVPRRIEFWQEGANRLHTRTI